MAKYSLFVFSSILLLQAATPLPAQEAETNDKPAPNDIQQAVVTGTPVKLEVSRRYLKNFLTDDKALIPYEKPGDGSSDLTGAFMIGSPAAQYVAIWDPTSARLLGVLDLKAPKPAVPETTEASTAEDPEPGDPPSSSPYVLLAAGSPPLQPSSGAFGMPSYFGFRMDSGRPCFLYTHGSLIVEETIWLEDGGNILKQQFLIREPQGSVALRIPDQWKERASSDTGEWDGPTLKFPEEAAGRGTISYRLAPFEEEETP